MFFSNILLTFLPPNLGGTIKLRSTNLFDKPLIDSLPNHRIRYRCAARIHEAQSAICCRLAWADYVTSPSIASATSSDVDIGNYIQGVGSTEIHTVGTAAMSCSSSKYGVADQKLLLKGADGLRICICFRKFRRIRSRKTDLLLAIALHS